MENYVLLNFSLYDRIISLKIWWGDKFIEIASLFFVGSTQLYLPATQGNDIIMNSSPDMSS